MSCRNIHQHALTTEYTIQFIVLFILPSNRNIRNDLLFFSKFANVSKPSFPGIVPLMFYNKTTTICYKISLNIKYLLVYRNDLNFL